MPRDRSPATVVNVPEPVAVDLQQKILAFLCCHLSPLSWFNVRCAFVEPLTRRVEWRRALGAQHSVTLGSVTARKRMTP